MVSMFLVSTSPVGDVVEKKSSRGIPNVTNNAAEENIQSMSRYNEMELYSSTISFFLMQMKINDTCVRMFKEIRSIMFPRWFRGYDIFVYDSSRKKIYHHYDSVLYMPGGSDMYVQTRGDMITIHEHYPCGLFSCLVSLESHRYYVLMLGLFKTFLYHQNYLNLHGFLYLCEPLISLNEKSDWSFCD